MMLAYSTHTPGRLYPYSKHTLAILQPYSRGSLEYGTKQDRRSLEAGSKLPKGMLFAYIRQAIGKDLARGSQAKASYLGLLTPWVELGYPLGSTWVETVG